MEEQTYNNRQVKIETVTKIEESSFTVESGWTLGLGVDPSLEGRLKVGDDIVVETKNFSKVLGIQDLKTGEWYFRKSDQDDAREHAEMVAGFKREREDALFKHGDEWQAREDALPDWIARRLRTFHEKGGIDFKTDGWAYELCIAELAVLYAEHGLDDSDKAHPSWAYANEHGTSGNQHDFARVLARAYTEGHMEDAGDTVAGLSPITGSAYYEKEDA